MDTKNAEFCRYTDFHQLEENMMLKRKRILKSYTNFIRNFSHSFTLIKRDRFDFLNYDFIHYSTGDAFLTFSSSLWM